MSKRVREGEEKHTKSYPDTDSNLTFLQKKISFHNSTPYCSFRFFVIILSTTYSFQARESHANYTTSAVFCKHFSGFHV